MQAMRISEWFHSGAPWVWLSASAVAANVFLVAALLVVLVWQGFGHFWPHAVLEAVLPDGTRLIGEPLQNESVPAARLRSLGLTVPEGQELVERQLVKVGNRDLLGSDFRWLLSDELQGAAYPPTVAVIERREWGNFYGFIRAVKQDGQVVAEGDGAAQAAAERLERALQIHKQIRHIEKDEIGAINYGLERLRLQNRRLELDGDRDPAGQAAIEAGKKELQDKYEGLQQQLVDLYGQIRRDALVVEVSSGQPVEVPLQKVVHVYYPNAMGPFGKLAFYFGKLGEFVSDEPREANTEGGIFPAIFGTVLMVFIMTLLVAPFGVIAAVYLREYARQGPLTQLIRIAVNNLAGVPSIVYGVFGLGFFVYFLGGNIDRIFFPEALPAPTFGTPGLIWASLTLAILTVPVVIVSTEEGLTRIPRMIREGSLALGATKWETLWRTVLPMSSPAIMTGLILAIARAAGEVAPLMLVGVVKLAPSLPLDGNAPFIHLERKFMHLGFHIYDVGFQSPNVEAARPLVYATALLLVLVILALNLVAITIRNRLRERYRAEES
jgi:phosphate transport system permease protein